MSVSHFLTQPFAGEAASVLVDIEHAQQPLVGELFSHIKSVFHGRAKKQYGVCDDQVSPFLGELKQVVSGQRTHLTLLDAWIKRYNALIDASSDPIEGVLVCAHEQSDDGDQLWLAHVKSRSGLAFSKEFDIERTQWIEPSQTGFCVQVDLTALSQSQVSYLTITFGFSDRAHQSAILEAFGFSDTVDSAADTERFLALVSAYSEALPADKSHEYKKEAVSFCQAQESQGETVVPKEMGQLMAEKVQTNEAPSLMDYIEARAPEMEAPFIPDRNSLRRFKRYTGKSKEVSISFNNELLGKHIRFDPQSESLTIENLPAALLKQLKEATSKGDL